MFKIVCAFVCQRKIMSQATWAVALLTVLCVGLSKAADFADNTGGFDFIYHENHNLILTVYNETCYYASVPDGEKSLMASNGKTALEVK
nr:hypothetical protein BaRGS_029333 [Batillaria attramentaria]